MDVRFIKSQTSFKSGRLSPKLYNRIDTAQYKDGASVMRGFRIMPEGGADAIKGTRYINEASYSPFAGYEDAKLISFTINGLPVSVAIVASGFQTFATIYRYPYTFGTETNVVLSSSILEPDLFDWTVQDGYLILTHFTGNFEPQFLEFDQIGNYVATRTLSTSSNVQPFGDLKEDPITISNYTGSTVDLTSTDAAVVTYLQSKDLFYAEALGSRFNSGDSRTYNFVASNFYGKVSNIANGVRVNFSATFTEGGTATEILTFAGVTQIETWAANLWGANNWPKTVTVHEGRVVFGGNREKPLSIVGSRVNSVTAYNRLTYADTGSDVYRAGKVNTNNVPTDPYLFTISADEDSEITAIRSNGELFIGTDRKEYIATGGDTILSSISVQIKPYTTQGVYPISTETMGNLIVYFDRAKKKVFQFKFNDKNGTFLSDELSLLFDDKMEGDRIQQLVWASHVKVLYVLTENEILYGITYDPSTETTGFFETLQTDVSAITYVASRESLSGADGHHRGDHLLMVVRGKGIMSYEQTFFEQGESESYIKTDQTDANEYLYLEDVFEIKRNAANNYSINGQGYVTGSDNFPLRSSFPVFTPPFRAMNVDTGEVVTINSLVSDGGNPWSLIDDPAINGASKIIVGNLPSVPKVLATMPIEAGQQFGPAQLGIKNIDELGIRFYKSYSYRISSDGEKWQDVRVADSSGRAKTGRKETKFQGNPKYDFVVYIATDKPEPLTITGINMKGVSNDG